MKREYFDLTAPQKSIWLTEQYYSNTNINNVCGTFYSSEKIDFELLKKSLNIFLRNNDSFKIKLCFTNDEIKQYFSEIEDIDFEIVNIKNKEEQMALENKVASKVFNLIDSFLFEIVLFRYPDNSGGFVINSHHIIADSWSNSLVANEVALIYDKVKNNEPYEKSKELSYKSYLDAEKNYLNSAKFEKDKQYWEEVFSNVPEIATIPTVKNNEKDEDLSANRLLLNVDSKLLSTIQSYCEKNKISLFNFFMAVFSLYLGRVSNLDEFVIGTPILNRTNFKEKQTTGMFINTLPLKINLMHDKTFIENLKDIAINSMALLRHQKYSYQYIIEDLRKKDSNLPMLYNILYSYQITKMNENMDALNHTTSWTFNKTIADDMDIHMFEWNESNTINIAYDYRTSKYDEQDILDLHARILHIIEQILENENILLKDIEIVTPEEKHKILYEFNNTKTDYPKDKTIVDLFEEQVEKTPDNIAVVFEDQQLTYKELNEKANQLARYLIENGIKPGSVIAIMLNRSLEMIVGIIASLKCGCSYLPIDPFFPNDRIDYILDDSNVGLVLVSTSTISQVPNKYPTLNILFPELDYNKFSNSNLNLNCSINDILYLIYTSGSTGNPKGVMVSHNNLSNFITGIRNVIDFSENKTMLSITTISFDIFGLELWGALLNGLKLILASEKEQNSSKDLNTLCNKYNVSMIQTTPSRFNDLLLDTDNLSFFKNLTDIMVGGESLPAKLIEKFKNVTSANIFNMYGPTETTIWSTIKKINSADTISIGFPIANTYCYILDKNQNFLPPFTSGDLYISGEGVSAGYLHRPDLNEANFLPLHFNNDDQLLYRTGDLAYFGKSGEIFHMGRNDFQVKIRGYRIELGEIENKALSFPGITNAVVSSVNSKFLVLYYSCNKEINLDDLKKFLLSSLPAYMLPTFFKEIIDFPKTPNGKIDRKSLPKISINNHEQAEIRNDIDLFLVTSLKNILHLDTINISDSFFAIGGDSLLAIKYSLIISEKYDINISTMDILKNSILSELSDFINAKLNNRKTTILKIKNENNIYDISSAQTRIYYSCLKDKKSILYNISGGIILAQYLDRAKLENCFNQLINRHSSLRTYFENRKDKIVQIIKDTVDFNLEYEEVNTNDVNSIYSNFVKPFDLSKAPLFRTKLVKLKNNKEFLLLDIHHIISDGTSLNILLKELCSLYNDNELPNKKIEYKDFVVWEKDQTNNETLKSFWVNQFKDEIPLLNLPTTYPRPSKQSFEGSNYLEKLDSSTYKNIANVAKELNITPYMLLLSVYYVLLSKYTSQDDIIVGTPVIGRDLPELSNLLGMFVNSLPIRNKVDYSINFSEFTNIIKTKCLEVFRNGSYPFDFLVKDLNLKRDMSRNPLFDTMFIYQSEGYPIINFNEINSEYFIPNTPISKFDLSLEIVPINNEYQLRFEYCTKLFNEDFIKKFSSHYINILNIILKNNKIKISDIDMLSEQEKHQIIYEFNNTKTDYPKDKTIINLFEEQIEKTPDNIAVVFEDQQLTYKELNEKANQLARFLIANNTNLGDIVCILLDKSLDMIVSILGILKVGATFLPIDVNYPKERIDYIIRDSKSDILLTSQELINKANDTVQILSVELSNDQFSQYSTDNLNINYDVDNLAYIMYTSGSTGKPKGVMVTNKNVIRLVKNNKFISFEKQENILQTGSIVFDACTFEIWGALLNGFKLFIMKKESLLDAYLLKEYLFKNNISTLWLTAPLFNQLCESDPYMFKNVKALLTGGDVLSPKHINMVRKACPDLTVINGYGPTENTTFSCCFTIDKNYNNSIPIGKPISNSTAYVVSSSGGFLCPIGVPGELWVGGDGVSKGYLNNENLTNEKFIKNPFEEGIIYKTGDLVKWLPDGNIEFIGRIDNQVKIRGFRVELNEINKTILSNENITESFTTIKTINNTKHICSYIVTKSNMDINELRIYLSNFLPSYMIPSYFTKMEKLPINQNGKVDKNALPSDFDKYNSITNIEKPSTEDEALLLDLFKKVLNNNDIGITDNFFDVGGDSLTAMKLQIETMSKNLNITYSDIFKYPTVKELANSINSHYSQNKEVPQDFSKYDKLLSNNNLNKEIICDATPIGNVLLTGFTGFLGAHILDSFIKKETGKIYCLIRSKNNMTARERLFNVLHFYFENKYDNLVDDRIILIEGDITFDHLGLSEEDYQSLGSSISTIIHSAALVKHYGVYKDFEAINVIGTRNIVNVAKEFNIKLLHVSTISVSGNNLAEGANIDNHFEENIDYDETSFYVGQNLNNLYVRSKFEAEKIVFDAISEGLPACVLRMGNLTSRFSEGKFQQNHFENAFVNRIKSFLQIGMFPKELLNLYCEFTPIDFCGDAIINIANHFNPNYTVFHLLNEKHVYLDRLFDMFKQIGINLQLISEDEFASLIQKLLNDPEKKQFVTGIINDLTTDKKLVYESEVKIQSNFTKEFLYKTGFEWPYIDINYIRNYFQYLIDIGYLNVKIN